MLLAAEELGPLRVYVGLTHCLEVLVVRSVLPFRHLWFVQWLSLHTTIDASSCILPKLILLLLLLTLSA